MKFFDNTRIKDYKLCPRYFYYRHVRHWQVPGVSSALAFGTGWHSAMDEIWQGNSIESAINAWREEMIEAGIDYISPEYGLQDFRTEGTARAMLENYVEQRDEFLGSIELIKCEKPFAVPLDENAENFYVGRLDKVFKQKNRVFVVEHKTSSMYAKSGNFRTLWINQFSPNSQIAAQKSGIFPIEQ